MKRASAWAVDAFVVERMVSWREDALHLEGQPAAVAGRVRQELGAVACATEGCDMLAVLMIMGVCCSLVDARHGDGCLQLVQFGRAHGVKLLAADEGILRQGQDIVLRHAVGVGLGIEILLQRGWKEVVEPCGLVRSLLTDEHEDDVVDHIIGDPRSPPCRRATSSGRDATASAPARRPSHGRFELAHGYNLFLPQMDFCLAHGLTDSTD